MKTKEIIRMIVGWDVPVLQDFDIADYMGGACFLFLPKTKVEALLMVDPYSNDARTIGLVVHECFHVLRKQQGAAIYQRFSMFWGWKERCEEETEVNRLARAFLKNHYKGEVLEGALKVIEESEASYNPKRRDLASMILRLVAAVLWMKNCYRRLTGKRDLWEEMLEKMNVEEIEQEIAEYAL